MIGNTNTQPNALRLKQEVTQEVTKAVNTDVYKESVAEKVPFVKTAEQPEFANSIEECTDTSKLYVLPDGYLYAYMTKTIGGGTEEVTVDVTDGFADDYRISVSTGSLTGAAGVVTTPFIDFTQYPIDAEIRLSGIEWSPDAMSATCSLAVYDAEQGLLDAGCVYLGSRGMSKANAKYVANSTNDVIFTVYNSSSELDYKYVRFCGKGTSADAVVQIVYTQETEPKIVTSWMNTGHAFVPADYGDRVVSLEEDSAEHEIRLKLLEANTDVNGIPDYWLEELEAKADTIQQAMETAGRNKSAFLWYTDSHWQYTNAKVSPLLLDYLQRNTPINKINFGGDIVNDPPTFTHGDIQYVYEWRRMISDLPNHHSIYGNHDVNHRSTNVDEIAYALLLASEETPDMVVGGDSYYYIDNPSEKTRYLYLSFLSGTAYANEMLDQCKFIADSIKTVEDGWHIVCISHSWFQYTSSSEPTVGAIPALQADILSVFDAYNARTSRSSSNYFSAQDFSACKGKVEFCIGGHIHVDYDFESDGGIPVIITASDTNQPRGANETACGTIGTITESAVYGIVADYGNNKITVVGVGRGTSRTISY